MYKTNEDDYIKQKSKNTNINLWNQLQLIKSSPVPGSSTSHVHTQNSFWDAFWRYVTVVYF